MDFEEFEIEIYRESATQLRLIIKGKPEDVDKLQSEILEQALKGTDVSQ